MSDSPYPKIKSVTIEFEDGQSVTFPGMEQVSIAQSRGVEQRHANGKSELVLTGDRTLELRMWSGAPTFEEAQRRIDEIRHR